MASLVNPGAAGAFCTQAPSLRCAEEVIGCDRFLFGTDYPFHKSMTPAIDVVEGMDWTPEVKEDVFHRTARELFPKLPESGA